MNQPNFQAIQNAANAANMAAGAEMNQPAPPMGQPPASPSPGNAPAQGTPPYAPQGYQSVGYPGAQPYAQAPAPAGPAMSMPAAPAYSAYGYAPRPPEFTARPKDPRKSGAVRTLNKMGLLLVAQVGLSFLLQLGLVYGFLAAGYNLYADRRGLVLLSIAMSPLCTGLPFFVYLLIGHKDWNFHLRFQHRSVLGSILLVLAGLGVCMAANFPAAMLDEFLASLGAKETMDILGKGNTWEDFLLELVGIAVLVPMVEEFAFRGVILSSLRRFGTGFAIAASSVLFGMAHMSAVGVVFATISGAAMGTVYVLTGNLWASIAIHMLNNGIAVTESYAKLFVGSQNVELLSGAFMLCALGLGVIGLLLFLALHSRLLPKEAPMVPADGVLYRPLGFGEALAAILKSPVFWAVFAMVLVETAAMFL